MIYTKWYTKVQFLTSFLLWPLFWPFQHHLSPTHVALENFYQPLRSPISYFVFPKSSSWRSLSNYFKISLHPPFNEAVLPSTWRRAYMGFCTHTYSFLLDFSSLNPAPLFLLMYSKLLLHALLVSHCFLSVNSLSDPGRLLFHRQLSNSKTFSTVRVIGFLNAFLWECICHFFNYWISDLR